MKSISWFSLLFSILILFLIPVISSAQITVTSTADSGPGTLRQAVIDSAPSGTIDFALPGAPPHTITLTSGEIVIDKSLRITGSGKTDLIISGNSGSRTFRTDVGAVIVFITDLTISDGDVRGNAGVGGQKGGGIHHVSGLLFLADCVMSNNISGGDVDGGGGAVFASAFFRADRCEFLDNQTINLTGDSFGGAIDFRGGAGAVLTLADSRLEGNSSISQAPTGTADGGAVYATWDLISVPTVNTFRTQLVNNTAQGNTARGGGIFTASTNLTMVNNLVLDNTADGVEEGGGGGVYGFRMLEIPVGLTYSYDFENVTISRNTARGNLAVGGGIHVIGAFVSIENGTISENVAEAISGSETPRALGGGISYFASPSDLISTSIVFNQLGGPVGSEFIGPGLYTEGAQTNTTRYKSSLFAGNSFRRIVGVTIIGGTNCVTVESEGSVVPPNVEANGANISDDDLAPIARPFARGDACRVSFNPDFMADEMLGPLQNNGGLTLTHSLIDTRDMAPLLPNPAIDSIPDGDCTGFLITPTRNMDDLIKPNEDMFYRVNSSETYPFNGPLYFEPLFFDPFGNSLYKPIDYESEYLEMLDED